MNSFNNTINVELNSEVTSNSLLVNYSEWEEGYTPSEVWLVVPSSTKWSIDGSTPELIINLPGAVTRDDSKVEVRLEGMYLDNKTVTLYCTTSDTLATWTYLDINFPIHADDGSELNRYSLGWNIKTKDA